MWDIVVTKFINTNDSGYNYTNTYACALLNHSPHTHTQAFSAELMQNLLFNIGVIKNPAKIISGKIFLSNLIDENCLPAI